MTERTLPPFSARNRGAHAQVANDCPETARIGLLHLLHRLVDRNFVEGWEEVVRELQRITRVKPDPSKDPVIAERLLLALPWDRVFDFCERVYNFLAQECHRYDDERGAWVLVTEKNETQRSEEHTLNSSHT